MTHRVVAIQQASGRKIKVDKFNRSFGRPELLIDVSITKPDGLYHEYALHLTIEEANWLRDSLDEVTNKICAWCEKKATTTHFYTGKFKHDEGPGIELPCCDVHRKGIGRYNPTVDKERVIRYSDEPMDVETRNP